MVSSLRVWLVTLPDQRLTRPCLAECVLAIATGLVVNRVDSLVYAQCVVAFKTYSVELLSSETLVCVFVGSRLWWLVDYVSSWGTTRTDTCILLGNGSVHRQTHTQTDRLTHTYTDTTKTLPLPHTREVIIKVTCEDSCDAILCRTFDKLVGATGLKLKTEIWDDALLNK